MRTAETYTVDFGGTHRPVGSFQQEVSADSQVRLKVDSLKRAMMVTIGDGCRIHGQVRGMEVLRAALEFGVSELHGLGSSTPTSSDMPICRDCRSEHFANEPCNEIGTVTTHSSAYKIARRYTMMLPAGMPDLIVDSAALWVERGDPNSIVAARSLLRLFTSATDAEDIVLSLIDVYSRRDAEPPPLPTGDTAPQELPPGAAETR